MRGIVPFGAEGGHVGAPVTALRLFSTKRTTSSRAACTQTEWLHPSALNVSSQANSLVTVKEDRVSG